MLGRTANAIYWMARYVERAENLARLLASTYHMSLMPHSSDNGANHWQAPMALSGNGDLYYERYGEALSPDHVLAFTVLDNDNPSSIRSCVRQARENARATRTALTTEAWEAINHTYLDLEGVTYQTMLDRGYLEFFDWVRDRSHLFRGAIFGTMRRSDAFTFSRLGTFLERSDNTSRFLAAKWVLLAPGGHRPLTVEDYYRWGALLRAFSAFKAYREVYSVIIEPRRVAELLLFRSDMPRSLIACSGEVLTILKGLRADAQSTRLAAQIFNRIDVCHIDSILRYGLPRFLQESVQRNGHLHETISVDFRLVG